MEASERLAIIDGFVATQCGCLRGIEQQFANDGKVGSTSVARHSMIALVSDILILWRSGRGSDEFSAIVNQPTLAELGSTLHQRIGNGAQIVPVLCELVALP